MEFSLCIDSIYPKDGLKKNWRELNRQDLILLNSGIGEIKILI